MLTCGPTLQRNRPGPTLRHPGLPSLATGTWSPLSVHRSLQPPSSRVRLKQNHLPGASITFWKE